MAQQQTGQSHRVVVGTGQPASDYLVARTEAASETDDSTATSRAANLDVITLLPRVPVVGGLAAWALQGWQRDFVPRHYVPADQGAERPGP